MLSRYQPAIDVEAVAVPDPQLPTPSVSEIANAARQIYMAFPTEFRGNELFQELQHLLHGEQYAQIELLLHTAISMAGEAQAERELAQHQIQQPCVVQPTSQPQAIYHIHNDYSGARFEVHQNSHNAVSARAESHTSGYGDSIYERWVALCMAILVASFAALAVESVTASRPQPIIIQGEQQ